MSNTAPNQNEVGGSESTFMQLFFCGKLKQPATFSADARLVYAVRRYREVQQ